MVPFRGSRPSGTRHTHSWRQETITLTLARTATKPVYGVQVLWSCRCGDLVERNVVFRTPSRTLITPAQKRRDAVAEVRRLRIAT